MTSKKHYGKQTGRPTTHELPTPAGGVRLETFVDTCPQVRSGGLYSSHILADDHRTLEPVTLACYAFGEQSRGVDFAADDVLLRLPAQLEQALPWQHRRPKIRVGQTD